MSLNDVELDAIDPIGRLRIWAGGISHNALLALFCWLLSVHGLGIAFFFQSITLWEDIGSSGVVVQTLASVRGLSHVGARPRLILDT